MKRRSFLKCLGMAAVGFAAPRVLIEGSLNPPGPPPIPNPSMAFRSERDDFFFLSPVQAQNYRQLGYTLDTFTYDSATFDGSFFRCETDRRRIGRSIRKARREAALCRGAN